ncbi:MAG TPA: hypothetical protein VGM39_16945 [Kofleriaceae bacterium]|jgi:hypothetical protein
MPTPNLTVVSTPSTQPLESDPVPADVRAVIDLFTAHLAKVAFPDLDAAALRRHADDLRAEEKNVQRARDVLANAIATSDARLATLSAAAQRAVAYAQIYADGHVDRQPLSDALAALTRAPSAEVAPPAKRRGRPPKQRAAELFDATDDVSSAARTTAATQEVTS